MKLNNPFLIAGYHSPEYFCDRKSETEKIIKALENERNLTLIAPRRMGKTGLIKNVFYHEQKENDVVCIYMDIFSTQNLRDFLNVFAKSILGSLDNNFERLITRLGQILKSCRPTVSFDELTGSPNIGIEIANGSEEIGLKEIFNYIHSSGKRCVIAIDEFQQIAEYPEKGVEAMLRSHIQFVNNARFVFAGSKQHIMQEMFLLANRPFFQSTQILSIDSIDKDLYYEFALKHFRNGGFEISEDAFRSVYEMFDGHTWYVQAVLNRLYSYRMDIDDISYVNEAIMQLTEEGEYGYQNLIEAYTSNAVRLLRAIAHERCVLEVNSGEFISKYGLKAASSVNTSLKTLLAKEMVYKTSEGYIVYDRFMAIWLRRGI